MRELPSDIIQEMQIRFESEYPEAQKLLGKYVTENEYLDSDRIIRCIIFLSNNGLESFKSYLESAKTDPRDLMWWAEYERPTNATDKTQRIYDFNKPFSENSRE